MSARKPAAAAQEPAPNLRAFTVPQVARRIGVSERTVWSLIERGELRSRLIGRRRVVLPSDLADYLAALPDTPSVAARLMPLRAASPRRAG